MVIKNKANIYSTTQSCHFMVRTSKINHHKLSSKLSKNIFVIPPPVLIFFRWSDTNCDLHNRNLLSLISEASEESQIKDPFGFIPEVSSLKGEQRMESMNERNVKRNAGKGSRRR